MPAKKKRTKTKPEKSNLLIPKTVMIGGLRRTVVYNDGWGDWAIDIDPSSSGLPDICVERLFGGFEATYKILKSREKTFQEAIKALEERMFISFRELGQILNYDVE